MRFLGLHLEDRAPYAKTVWVFRECLKPLELVDVLFARFDEQLALRGHVAKAGQMIDATPSTGSGQASSKPRASGIRARTPPSSKPVSAISTGVLKILTN